MLSYRMNMKRLYIATPINARTEKTLEEKKLAAKHRVNMLKEIISEDERFDEYTELVSTFDISTIGSMTSEEQALGMCVTAVLESNAIYLDHGWTGSKGCNLEYRAAKLYDKKIYEHDKL